MSWHHLILVHDNNAGAYCTVPAKKYVKNVGWEPLSRPPDIPDLITSDDRLFMSTKMLSMKYASLQLKVSKTNQFLPALPAPYILGMVPRKYRNEKSCTTRWAVQWINVLIGFPLRGLQRTQKTSYHLLLYQIQQSPSHRFGTATCPLWPRSSTSLPTPRLWKIRRSSIWVCTFSITYH